MVEEANGEQFAALFQAASDRNILRRRRWIAGRMVVRDNDPDGIENHRSVHHDLWIDNRRGCGAGEQNFEARNALFISDALAHGVNIKWLAEYCGTSVAMIEKHYGRYVKSESQEQLQRLFGAKTETFPETLRTGTDDIESDVTETNSEVIEKEDETEWKREKGKWSGRVDLNHRLHGPEPCALPS